MLSIMENRETIVELINLIDKHMQESRVIMDYQIELDKLKEKWRNYEQAT